MTIKKIVVPLVIIVGVFLTCLGVYFIIPQSIKWAITSQLDVPACSARIAERLGIQSNYAAVKHYIIQSLETGMTSDEVEQTLSKIGPVEKGRTFIDEEQKIHTQVVIKLCDNPFGDVALLLYYSEDGHLLRVTDPYEE